MPQKVITQVEIIIKYIINVRSNPINKNKRFVKIQEKVKYGTGNF